MDEWGSKSGRLYEEIRHSLQNGRYAPGARIDTKALASQFRASITPVRHALYRLVGEGLVDDHARDGFYVPLVTELYLRDLYDWLQHLLILACDSGSPQHDGVDLGTEDDGDTVAGTRTLFEEIAEAAGSPCLSEAVRRSNDRLEPIRRTEIRLLDDTSGELVRLRRFWRHREAKALKAGLIDYHKRRKQLVPCLVVSMGGASSAPLSRASRFRRTQNPGDDDCFK